MNILKFHTEVYFAPRGTSFHITMSIAELSKERVAFDSTYFLFSLRKFYPKRLSSPGLIGMLLK